MIYKYKDLPIFIGKKQEVPEFVFTESKELRLEKDEILEKDGAVPKYVYLVKQG